MKQFFKITLLIFSSLLMIGCAQGILIADPFWAVLMKNQGENPAAIARKAGLAYVEVSGAGEEEVRDMLLSVVKRRKAGSLLILSPWLQKFVESIDKERFRIGLLNIQGAPAASISGVRGIKVLRKKVLESLVKTLNENDEQILLIYNCADDFYTISKNIKDENNLFAMYAGTHEDMKRIEENTQTLLTLRDIKTVFILAEPYNYFLWQQLEEDFEEVEHVYTGGVPVENPKIHLIGDNVQGQIEALADGENLYVEAELKK